MSDRIRHLAEQIKQLEAEMAKEVQRLRIPLYEIRDNSIRFLNEVRQRHLQQRLGLFSYLRRSKLKHLLTAPVIWLCLLPIMLLDFVVTLYQLICFPVYGIPKVHRRDHVVIDRHHLAYLNIIEKLNCLYCSYFNGVISYVREIAAYSEQYWCPIKHAGHLKSKHSRYAKFVEYGDSEAFQSRREALRTEYEDASIDDIGRR